MISKELREVFAQAVTYAKGSKHEYLTIEHIFLMLLNDELIENMLSDLGLDTNKIFIDVKKHIDDNTPKLPKDVMDDPVETVTLTSIIEHMVAHTQTSGKGVATVDDMFVAILKDEKSFATYLLKIEGIERVDILEEISHKENEFEYDDENAEEKKNDVLEKNSTELVALAKKGKIDPVIGREKEIHRVIQILSRRKKNNPILIGEPGVGKTAIVEGLALEISQNNVPHTLEKAKVYSLDMGSMLAGTKYRGDFEKKLKSLLEEISKVKNAILFIDEIHTIVGAGSVGGSAMDASNILKPMLASGNLKCIGATTFAEFRNDFSKDKALSRRFAKVDVNEPSIENCIEILEGLKPSYEDFHHVKFNKNAIKVAVELSKKHFNDRFLPDSAIDVIDEVAATKKLELNSDGKSKKAVSITQKDVENTVSMMANIPAKSATKSDLSLLKSLERNMQKRVFGQDGAISAIVKAIKVNRAGLGGENKPIGSFLFTGPTGVGKTEVSKELSSQLGIHFERFDMSEYMEAHTISRLIGAPAGYVGFEKGGLLTEAIRKHPHCVLLLDEIEKAHPDLMSILLQVMDNASLTDNNGNIADFQNVILIMTSNLGSSEASVMGFAKDDSLNEDKAVKKFFAPEFRNRLDATVSFAPLSIEIVSKIATKFVSDMAAQITNKNVEIKMSNKAKKQLATLGYDKAMGARPLNRVIAEHIKMPLTDEILFGKLKNGGVVNIDFVKDVFTFDIKATKNK